MARAKVAPKDDSAGLTLTLAGKRYEVNVQTFTIPESAMMAAAIARLTSDAAAVMGVEIKTTPDMFIASAAYVVARRDEPTLTYDDWFNRFTMAELQEAVSNPERLGGDHPEA